MGYNARNDEIRDNVGLSASDWTALEQTQI
jgi:hypothetical protein